MNELDVLVVGGGVSGLAVAHCLARRGYSVQVWESSDRVGGKIKSTVRDGFRLESAASMVVNLRCEIDAILGSAGLAVHKRARAPTARRYVLDGDGLQEVPTRPAELLTTPLFSTRGKLRLLLEPLVPRAGKPGETVAQFVTRRLGKEFLDKVFEPYVAGPLASDVDQAEAMSATPRLTALEHRYGSITLGALRARFAGRGSAGRPQMFSFAGGMQTMIDVLARSGGFDVGLNQRAGAIEPVAGGWMVKAAAGAAVHAVFARQLVLCAPADAAADLVGAVDKELACSLRAIEYAPIRVVHAGFDRSHIAHPLDGSGFLVPRRSSFAANGCLWMSSLFPDCAPEGRVLLTSYLGGARNRQAADWDHARLLAAVMDMLRRLLGARAQPDMLHIESHARALPLYHGGYAQRLQAIDDRLARLTGLHLIGNYKGGVSVRDRLLCADLEAGRIARQLRLVRGPSAPRCVGASVGPVAADVAMAPAAS